MYGTILVQFGKNLLSCRKCYAKNNVKNLYHLFGATPKYKGLVKLSCLINGVRSPLSTKNAMQSQSIRFDDSFYDVSSDMLAKNLLGHILVRKLDDGKILKGRIVETECYPGGDDKASHSYLGKMTERNAPMYMKPGTAYVYFTYGKYYCFNISSQGPGAAVLLRAIEPIQGMEFMQNERMKKRKVPCVLKPHQLANGPSKLCISMKIDKESCNAQDMSSWDGLWVEKSPTFGGEDVGQDWLAAVTPHMVVATSRIGIDSSGIECVSKPYRFYIIGNSSVSKRDRIKERLMASENESSGSGVKRRVHLPSNPTV